MWRTVCKLLKICRGGGLGARGCFSFDALFIIVCASVTLIFIFYFVFILLSVTLRCCPKKAHFSPRGTAGCKNIQKAHNVYYV